MPVPMPTSGGGSYRFPDHPVTFGGSPQAGSRVLGVSLKGRAHVNVGVRKSRPATAFGRKADVELFSQLSMQQGAFIPKASTESTSRPRRVASRPATARPAYRRAAATGEMALGVGDPMRSRRIFGRGEAMGEEPLLRDPRPLWTPTSRSHSAGGFKRPATATGPRQPELAISQEQSHPRRMSLSQFRHPRRPGTTRPQSAQPILRRPARTSTFTATNDYIDHVDDATTTTRSEARTSVSATRTAARLSRPTTAPVLLAPELGREGGREGWYPHDRQGPAHAIRAASAGLVRAEWAERHGNRLVQEVDRHESNGDGYIYRVASRSLLSSRSIDSGAGVACTGSIRAVESDSTDRGEQQEEDGKEDKEENGCSLSQYAWEDESVADATDFLVPAHTDGVLVGTGESIRWSSEDVSKYAGGWSNLAFQIFRVASGQTATLTQPSMDVEKDYRNAEIAYFHRRLPSAPDITVGEDDLVGTQVQLAVLCEQWWLHLTSSSAVARPDSSVYATAVGRLLQGRGEANSKKRENVSKHSWEKKKAYKPFKPTYGLTDALRRRILDKEHLLLVSLDQTQCNELGNRLKLVLAFFPVACQVVDDAIFGAKTLDYTGWQQVILLLCTLVLVQYYDLPSKLPLDALHLPLLTTKLLHIVGDLCLSLENCFSVESVAPPPDVPDAMRAFATRPEKTAFFKRVLLPGRKGHDVVRMHALAHMIPNVGKRPIASKAPRQLSGSFGLVSPDKRDRRDHVSPAERHRRSPFDIDAVHAVDAGISLEPASMRGDLSSNVSQLADEYPWGPLVSLSTMSSGASTPKPNNTKHSTNLIEQSQGTRWTEFYAVSPPPPPKRSSWQVGERQWRG